MDSENEVCMVHMDFSENYGIRYIKMNLKVHWSNDQLSLFIINLWFRLK